MPSVCVPLPSGTGSAPSGSPLTAQAPVRPVRSGQESILRGETGVSVSVWVRRVDRAQIRWTYMASLSSFNAYFVKDTCQELSSNA